MKTTRLAFATLALLALLALLAMTAGAPAEAGAPNEDAESAAAVPPPSLQKVADGVWMHVSYGLVPGLGPFLSHGLVVDTGGGVLLVDTAWTEGDTKTLLGLIEQATGELPTAAVVTHAHADKMGGMEALAAAGVPTYAHPLTNADAPARDLLPAERTILDDRDAEVLDGLFGDSGQVEVFYPGPGHTRDNIVLYYAPARVLFGGCLIRPGASKSLGNTADADVPRWAESVRAVQKRFPDVEIVIPSHGPKGGRELLSHTIELAEAAAGS